MLRGKYVEDKNRNRGQGNRNLIDINPTISVITLNINDLNAPVESQRLSKWIRNTTQLYAVYMNSTDSYRLKIKG